MSGKGSKPRPFSVSHDEYAKNFDKVFNKSEVVDDFTELVIDKNEYYDIIDTFSILSEINNNEKE